MAVSATWHRKALSISTMLTRSFYTIQNLRPVMARPLQVIRVLNEANIDFLIMGTHAATGYRDQPRATQDVDVLVRKRDLQKAEGALREAYPKLAVAVAPDWIRFLDKKSRRVVIDLLKMTPRFCRVAFRNWVSVGDEYRIPNLEMCLAAKHLAFTCTRRDQAKRFLDAGDYLNILNHNKDDLDHGRLIEIADGIEPGRGALMTKLLEDIQAGRRIVF